ncbi:MAG: T9SS type A sorting domain-containing protein [Candidatus Eisenbacteria bacterium]|nr:T9SS type A sorting domain-containing protein [Candidatus Eisenbacteria bacterium]
MNRALESALTATLLVLWAGMAYAQGDVPPYTHQPTTERPGGPKPSSSEPPFVIHYGLNDSHGRSWVREDGKGVVGITYFQRNEGSYDEGTLLYRAILPDGSTTTEQVTTGRRLEKSVLLYDAQDAPHIFVARSDSADQVIDHYSKDGGGQWGSETIVHFYNEGGKFIYELSADTGPDHSFHLLVLKTRSNVDSDDFMNAWMNSYMYLLTNESGVWERECVHNFDMAYTYDMCIKSSIRQDLKIDSDGHAHVAFGVQFSGTYDPSRLMYATNETGTWQVETALTNTYGPVDDAGWFPSLCLDNNGVPHIACIYLNRVLTHSVMYSRLLLLKRLGPGDWQVETVAQYDDGYYGSDGRDYTGALCHLVFDSDNTPRMVFSDIAATHWDWQRLNVGNIRYAVQKDGAWRFQTIYRQPLPQGFFDATEMLWMCLVVSERTRTVHVIGQEIEVTGQFVYNSKLLEFAWPDSDASVPVLPSELRLSQNYPNPFSPGTSIRLELPMPSRVSVKVFDLLGHEVDVLLDEELAGGTYFVDWRGTDRHGDPLPAGVYLYRVNACGLVESRKMLLLR